MNDVKELIQYSKLAGHNIYIKQDKIMVQNGKTLKPQHKQMIELYRDKIYLTLQDQEVPLF